MKSCRLLGGGIRNEYFVDIYHVSLYSDAKSIEEIQRADISHHVAIRIKILTDILPDTPSSVLDEFVWRNSQSKAIRTIYRQFIQN